MQLLGEAFNIFNHFQRACGEEHPLRDLFTAHCHRFCVPLAGFAYQRKEFDFFRNAKVG